MGSSLKTVAVTVVVEHSSSRSRPVAASLTRHRRPTSCSEPGASASNVAFECALCFESTLDRWLARHTRTPRRGPHDRGDRVDGAASFQSGRMSSRVGALGTRELVGAAQEAPREPRPSPPSRLGATPTDVARRASPSLVSTLGVDPDMSPRSTANQPCPGRAPSCLASPTPRARRDDRGARRHAERHPADHSPRRASRARRGRLPFAPRSAPRAAGADSRSDSLPAPAALARSRPAAARRRASPAPRPPSAWTQLALRRYSAARRAGAPSPAVCRAALARKKEGLALFSASLVLLTSERRGRIECPAPAPPRATSRSCAAATARSLART